MEVKNFSEWTNFFGTSASIGTILQMLSPVPTCYYFIRKQSVGDMIVTPYAVALTSCSLWFIYGLLIGDGTVVRVNLIASGLQFSYTMCYYIYTTKKSDVRKQMGLSLLTILIALTYCHLETDNQRLLKSFGLLCCCMTILFFASPLANTHHVIKVWNSESLPRLLISSTFVVSILWLVYGILKNDNYILVTNLLGTILAGIQLILICIIPAEVNPKLLLNV